MHPRYLAALTLASLAACAQPVPEGPPAIRLVDLFSEATVEGPETAAADAKADATGGWRFDGESSGDATLGWRAGAAVEGLVVRDGRLAGRTAGDFPLIHVERDAEGGEDLLHSVELDLRASAGNEVSLSFSDDEELMIEAVLGRARTFPWTSKAALTPGDEVRHYSIRPGFDVAAKDVRHLLLRPTDAEGADFEVESVRLVFRSEHIATTGAGIGWHGMSNVYHEAIATRASEVARFSLTLPARPWLDLALASIDAGPVAFSVTVSLKGSQRNNAPEGSQGSSDDQAVLERTLTTPHRWEPAVVDLAEYAGREVSLALRVDADSPGASGFWGSPVVRNRNPPPTRTAGAGTTTGDGAPERPQGVIVIVGDTLRSDHLNAWGYGRETAPTLAALAAGGVRAEDCISQATWTKVSVPSIFTSLYPLTHGVRDFTDRLPASATTMAESFRDAGYATLGLSSIPFTGKMTNLHQGYEEFYESSWLPRGRNAKTARTYVDELANWLERHRDAPFFVFLHVADPHSPYLPYEPFDTLWGEAGDQEQYKKQQDAAREHIANPLMKRFGMPERHELEAAGVDPQGYVDYELDAYDGSIRAMDVEIARLLERLRQLGLEESTLIAFVSDHGTEFLDHDRHFHGHSVYGELARVPLLLHGPNVPAGQVISHTIQSLDLMPTVLELAGLEAPEGMQGQSLVPLFATAEKGSDEDRRWRARPAFTEKAPTGDDGQERGARESYAIVLDGWKLIHNPSVAPEGRQRDNAEADGFPEIELYNHREDPLNHRDLAAELPELVAPMRQKLEAWRQSAEAARLTPDSALAENMSEEDLERLRSLGYVQ